MLDSNNNQVLSSTIHTPVPGKLTLTLDQFLVGRKLARGKIGNVYVVKSKAHHFIAALKVLNKSEIIREHLQLQLKREIEIQACISHPNILKMYNYFYDDHRVYLVLEYAPKGELFRVLQRITRFTDESSSRIIRQVMDALEYCHSQQIIHRDIKPENILIGYNGQVKVSDFGWSIRSRKIRQTQCGTLDYLAPEIVSQQSYDHRVDLWCLGVLTFELLVGKPPFLSTNSMQTRQMIRECCYTIPNFVSPYASDFIQNLLVVQPSKRMSLEQAKSHLWIQLYEIRENRLQI